jgi:hypothetical protein
MPAYVTSPFKPVPALLVSGNPSYLYGSFDDKSSPTQGAVLTNAGVTTTATLAFLITSGKIPVVGELITVIGCANSANFNVTNVAIASVSVVAATGVCTVTYAISSTTQGTLADVGAVFIPRAEVGEALGNGSSAPVAAPFNNPQVDQGKVLSVSVKFPSLPTATTVKLQGANFDIDAEYEDIATVATVAGGVVTVGPDWNTGQGASGTAAGVNQLNYRFYRLNVSGTSGGSSPTIVGKIEC